MPDNLDKLTYHPELLLHAAHMWKASGSALPPTPQEILYRDQEWDHQVVMMLHTMEFYLDYDKRPAHLK